MTFLKQNDAIYHELQSLLDGVHDYGTYSSCICPYHQSEPVRASLFFYIEGHDFKCRSCGEYGSLEKLKSKVTHQPIRASVDTVSLNVQVPFRKWLRKFGSYERAANDAHRTAVNNPFLVSYLEQRNIQQYIERGRFGIIDGYLSFPVYDQDGDFVDWVVRKSPRKIHVDSKYAVRPHERNDPPHLYCPSWNRVDKRSVVCVPFGILDAWSIYAAGYASITTITGQTINSSMFSDIRKKIVVIPDIGEEPAARKFVSELGWRGKLLIPDYPDGCKDMNDVHCKYGLDKVRELINL